MEEPRVMVYLMTGFLDSGKTQFLKFTLSQDYFQIDGLTLLILCEEGEEEYDEKKLFRENGVKIVRIEDQEELTEKKLQELEEQYHPERVIVEYNGMWKVSDFEALELPEGWGITQKLTTVDAETFDTNVSTLLLRYRENALFAQLNLLDSHDVSRYLSLCGENTDKMELSVLLQMTFPGMPCVFYGDEKGLCGLSESEYRQAMAWGKSHPLEDIYRRLISLRKAHPALRYGDFVTNFAAGKTYSYSRNWENTRITVTMNLGGAPIPAPQTGRLLLKKGGNHAIIGAWEYEVREERIHGGDDL